MDSGHPELWKMHSSLEMMQKSVERSQSELQRITAEIEHLQLNVSESLSEVSQHNQLVDELQKTQRQLESDLVCIPTENQMTIRSLETTKMITVLS